MTELAPRLIFDRGLIRRRRDRAAGGFAAHADLAAAVAEQLAERLADVKKSFALALILGAPCAYLAHALAQRGVEWITGSDLSFAMLAGDGPLALVAADDEALPFKPASFDLIIGNLTLHRVNDVPGVLAQIRQALKPGGLFLGAFAGGYTLHEWRGCLMEAEIVQSGGASLRLHPTIAIADASALLQRAGFLLPVTDQEVFTLTYTDVLALMRDLRGMGEGNGLRQRAVQPLSRAVLRQAEILYRQRFGVEGRLPASFDMIFLHGWAHE